jgi:hypothetical protein
MSCPKPSRRTSYESKTLTKAFEEITGIKVNHQLLGEGEVVQAVQTQMQTNRNLYDAYVNDRPDRHPLASAAGRQPVRLDGGRWADVTNPTLDLDDFMGISFTTGPDGKLYQLPDQQFANLYWFRKDWFDREDLQASSRKYGYDLGVPSTGRPMRTSPSSSPNDVKEIDGVTDLWPHGLRQARAGPRLAHDRCLAVDGRAIAGPAQRPPDRRMGHPHGRRFLQPGRRQRCARRRRPTARRRSMRSASGTNGCASTPLPARRL